MSTVSAENKKIAKSLAELFGGDLRVTRYRDDNQESAVDLLFVEDSICPEVTSIATVSLSDSPLMFNGEEFHVRTEILGACYRRYQEDFAHVLACAAFCIINSKWFPAPGVIFPDAVGEYFGRGQGAEHLLFATPCLWGEGLPKTMELETKTVAWLTGVPITEREYRFAEEHGSEALESVLEEKDVDVCDLQRPCVFS